MFSPECRSRSVCLLITYRPEPGVGLVVEVVVWDPGVLSSNPFLS